MEGGFTRATLPTFSINDYDDWKIRMQAHLASMHEEMWSIIEDGPPEITKANTDAAGLAAGAPQVIPKPRSEWTQEEKKRANLDNQARNVLYQTLDRGMFSKVKSCETAKEIWEKLAII